MANKVKYGISKAFYAEITGDGENGFPIYGEPKPLPGAVSLSLDPQGDINKFNADNIVYYQTVANNGYEGDLVLALIPEDFLKDILKEEVSQDKVLMENASIETAKFALLVQFEGDEKATRHVFWNCTTTRPATEQSTVEETRMPQTDTLTISSVPLENGYVKAKTMADTLDTTYNNWYDSVWTPSYIPAP